MSSSRLFEKTLDQRLVEFVAARDRTHDQARAQARLRQPLDFSFTYKTKSIFCSPSHTYAQTEINFARLIYWNSLQWKREKLSSEEINSALFHVILSTDSIQDGTLTGLGTQSLLRQLLIEHLMSNVNVGSDHILVLEQVMIKDDKESFIPKEQLLIIQDMREKKYITIMQAAKLIAIGSKLNTTHPVENNIDNNRPVLFQ